MLLRRVSVVPLSFALALAPAAIACDATPTTTDAATQVDDAREPSDASAADAPPASALSTLAGPDEDPELGDLDALASVVGDAELVGIGECVHTTGGQVRMRARMIRWLVTHADLRVVYVESPRASIAERADAFVISDCSGDAEEAASGFHNIWWDRSTPELLRWLCAWNAEHTGAEVRLRGVDIRQPWVDAPALDALYARLAPSRSALADAMHDCLGASYADEAAFFTDPQVLRYYGEGGMEATPEPAHLACDAAADAILADLAAHRSDYLAASSDDELEGARLSALSMRAFDDSIYALSRGDLAASNPPRDQAMAEILLTQRRLAPVTGRAVLWAHDGHVLRDSTEVVGGQWRGVENLATLVDRELDYVAIGQISRIARILWMSGPETIRFESMGSMEMLLDAIGPEQLMVDLRVDPSIAPDEATRVGFDTMRPTLHYDALVYLRDSPAIEYFRDPRPGS